MTSQKSSFIEQLHEKYCPNEETNNTNVYSPDVIVTGEVQTISGNKKPIEFIGAKKLRTQQTFETIEKISLSGCQIHIFGALEDGQRLATLVPKLTELDLSRNLLTSWSEILKILREFPRLETLILSGNQISLDQKTKNQDPTANIFENVKVLVLNQTLLHWTQVEKIVTRHFPKLEQLHLVGNGYQDEQLRLFKPMGDWTKTLRVLDLSQNDFVSWNLVLQTIGTRFLNLRQLLLNGNGIVTLGVDRRVTGFQKLVALSLSENLIDSWTSIDALNAFPLLSSLRVSNNPLTSQMSVGEARMLLVARTDHISVVNASDVRKKERIDAEQLYLKRILHELAVFGNKANERKRVLAEHPRYTRLRELYPAISIDQIGTTGSGSTTIGPCKLASSLIEVSLVPMSMQAASLEPVVKKIPQQMKVLQLKLLVEAKFGIEVPRQVLSFRTDSRSMPELLDDDNVELSYYGIQSGSEVLVNDNK